MTEVTFNNMPQLIADILFQNTQIEALLRELLKSPAPTPTKDTLTVKEAAAFLGRKTQTIYNLVSQRVLPHYKVNGTLLFKKDELQKFIDAGKVSTIEEINLGVDAILSIKKGGKND